MTTHTDKELLELAARTAGLNGYIHEWINGPEFIIPGENPVVWNPVRDDGDALRLAVKTGEPFVVRTRCVTTMGGLIKDFDPNIAGDDLRATRRAIVRAAAEIQLQREKA